MNDSRTSTRILIAFAHPVFRLRLRSLLESNRDFAIAGEASNATQTLALAGQISADVLLLDVDIARQYGLHILQDISTLDQRIRVILLTRDVKKSEILRALQLGARGVLRKNSGESVLFKSIQCVMDGELWVTRKLAGDLIDILRKTSVIQPPEISKPSRKPVFRDSAAVAGRLERKRKSSKQVIEASIASTGWKKYGLTRREMEIIVAVVDGKSNRTIAATNGISEATVKHHIMHIFDKVGVHSRLELAVLAIHYGLIIFPDA
jgi:DNA-binding NarL/FixJ family response regulator